MSKYNTKWEFTECTSCDSKGNVKMVFDVYSDDGRLSLSGVRIDDLVNLADTLDEIIRLYRDASSFVAEEPEVYRQADEIKS